VPLGGATNGLSQHKRRGGYLIEDKSIPVRNQEPKCTSNRLAPGTSTVPYCINTIQPVKIPPVRVICVPQLLPAIVGRFPRDLHVVRMALAHAGIGDLNKRCVLEVGNVLGTAIPHTRS
jgi:hypothetical protein